MDREHDPERDQIDERPPAKTLPTAQHEAGAERILGLQRTVGNQAVGAMLARDAAPGKTQPAAPKAEQAAAADYIEIPGLGRIPTVTLRLEGQSSPTTRTGGSAQQKFSGISVTTHSGKHSPKLQKAAIDGETWAKGVEVACSIKGGCPPASS